MASCVLLCVAPLPTLAAEPASVDGKALAKQKVLEGQELYEQARYEEALVAFQDAAAAYASPDFQFNIGLCHERLGEPRAAIRAFEAYLRNKPDASDRASVEHRIDALRTQLEQPEPPPPRVEPETEPPPATVDDGVPTKPHRPLVIGGSVLVGVGAATMIGGGVGFGVLANRRAERVDGVISLDNPDDLTRDEAREIAAQGDRFRALQIGSLAVGAAASIAGAVLLVEGMKRRRSARLSLLPTPGGLSLSGTF